MNYKGYEASVHYSEDDQIFWGEVININSPTTILFEAENAKDLKKEFIKSVDFYLDVCKKKNKDPKKPMSGKFIVRLDPKEHARLASEAKTYGVSINSLVKQAIHERLNI